MWEQIRDALDGRGVTSASHRLAVPGGWIVRTVASRADAGVAVTQTFVEDRHHTWKLEESKQK